MIDEWSYKDMQHCYWFLNKFDQEHLLWLTLSHLIISYNFLLLRKNSLPNLKWTRLRDVFALCRNQSEFIKFTTAGWMIGFDISLTNLFNFDLCTSDEPGPRCICRSNQSVQKRLKIIHLNFQNMEVTSVHHNSRQLFQCSNVVHIISVLPHED